MSVEKLKYLSVKVANGLLQNVTANLNRYRSGDFSDLAREDGWSIELGLDVDLDPLKELKGDKGTEAEVRNSLLVWKALSRLTPSLACENRIWTRLTHVECLGYSRQRWLNGIAAGDLESSVRTHFFADIQTRCRDDNAIGRLWWSAYIAHKAMPHSHEAALKVLLKKADIRSNIVERTWTTSRTPIAAGILRAIVRKPAIAETESAFREFMKTVNCRGGGILFELMDDCEIDSFMDACAA